MTEQLNGFWDHIQRQYLAPANLKLRILLTEN